MTMMQYHDSILKVKIAKVLSKGKRAILLNKRLLKMQSPKGLAQNYFGHMHPHAW